MVEVGMLSGRVRTGMCILVAVVWSSSIFLSMVNPDYQPDPAINAIFSGVIGMALTVGNKGDKDQPPKPRRRP